MLAASEKSRDKSSFFVSLRERESLWRLVLWIEALVVISVLLSIALARLELEYGDVYNMILVFLLAAFLLIGIILFFIHDFRVDPRGLLLVVVFLAGCLILAYSTLMYESGSSETLLFMLTVLGGAALTVLGAGLMVVRLTHASRVIGYFSIWLFGILLLLFMPLHELGIVLQYSGRDLLMSYLGLAISIIGAISFALEQRKALNVESWITSGDAKYISGKYDEAIEYYDLALAVETKNEFVWSSKGAALLKLGLWTDAIDCFDRAMEVNTGLSSAHSGKGLALTYLKRFSEALASHDLAIKHGKGPVGWNNKGNTLMRMGSPEDALECYKSALAENNEYEIAWFNKGKAEMALRQFDGAVLSFTRAVSVKPEFADAWYQKGKALVSAEKSANEALFCFDTAIQLKPSNSDAWMDRKILMLSMRERKARPIPIINIPEGIGIFGPAAREKYLLPGMEEDIEEFAIVAGADAGQLRNQALKNAAQGNYDMAVKFLDTSIAKYPNDPVTFMSKGVLLSRIEQFDGALAAFDGAIKVKPEWVGPWFGKGMVLAAKGDYEAALKSLDEAIFLRQNYADAWSVRGIILGIQRKYEDAIKSFDKVIELKPDDEEVWRSKSIALNKLGRYEEAITCYEKLATLSPAVEETQKFLLEEKEKLEGAKALFRKGVGLAKSRMYEEGLEKLKEAIDLRPNYIEPIYISGVIYGVMGEYHHAADHFDRVLELRPRHVEAIYGKGSIRLKEGKNEEALELFDRALELNDNHVDAWCDRGLALARMGNNKDAMECYDRALELAGDHDKTISLRESCVKAIKEARGE